MGSRAHIITGPGRAGWGAAAGLAAVALVTTPAAAAAQSTALDARPAGGISAQDRPDIPHPNPETDSSPEFDAADFWEGYLGELGYAG